jgi:hypothetical protein
MMQGSGDLLGRGFRRVERYVLGTDMTATLERIGEVRLLDVSVLGARLELLTPLERGTKVKLRFRPNEHSIHIQLSGTVVWCVDTNDGGPAACGIEFDQEAAALRSAIDQLCRAGAARRV